MTRFNSKNMNRTKKTCFTKIIDNLIYQKTSGNLFIHRLYSLRDFCTINLYFRRVIVFAWNRKGKGGKDIFSLFLSLFFDTFPTVVISHVWRASPARGLKPWGLFCSRVHSIHSEDKPRWPSLCTFDDSLTGRCFRIYPEVVPLLRFNRVVDFSFKSSSFLTMVTSN